jgi:DNA-binding MarR family transcriptional regulator
VKRIVNKQTLKEREDIAMKPLVKRRNNRKAPALQEIEEIAGKITGMDFWLCVRFTDVVRKYLQVTMKEDQLSPLQFKAMWQLVVLGGSSNPTELARNMLCSKHSMTLIIDGLEKEGLVVREFATNKDRRVTHVKITGAGIQYVRENVSRGNQRAKKVMGCLDVTEQKLLVNLTERMRKRMMDLMNESETTAARRTKIAVAKPA